MPTRNAQHLVVDIGGSHVTAAAVRIDATAGPHPAAALVSRVERGVDPHESSDPVLDAWAAACRDAAVRAGVDPGACEWGLAMPGPFDYERGIAHYAGVGKFDHLAGVDIRSGLAARLGAEARRIHFVHDAAAYGIGEWRFGAGAGTARRFVCITLGTGVGSAFVDDGRLVFDRPDVPPGGEAHRLTFAGRPLEDTVSTRALLARYGGASLTVKDLATRARAGDHRAQLAFDTAMAALAHTIAPWLASFGTTDVVLGGAISRSWDVLERGFRAGLAQTGTDGDLRIVPSGLLADAPLFGAAHLLEQLAAGPCLTAPSLA
ncbi:glucokinase [Leifsonia sp. LS1]|uniref:ROK family protein n=1 Tax=Leifsonia sp. LS1 TaxID=2828483 RepID=UPI001CFC571D|nr:ROK family protein [Leifsonia sp. LS1]GIT78721.1 glucokinase [Leifsonia sp. LS1]